MLTKVLYKVKVMKVEEKQDDCIGRDLAKKKRRHAGIITNNIVALAFLLLQMFIIMPSCP